MSKATKPKFFDPPKSLDDRMMETLPKPPRPFSEQSDGDIEWYMRQLADAGGIEALQWFYRPENWVFGSIKRGRLQHVHGALLRKLDDEARQKREREAAERAERLRNEDREARKLRGWA